MKNKIAIIGYTGLIGSNIYNQFKKKYKYIDLFNSKNIHKIRNKNYKAILCAGLPAEKWKANKFPKKDKLNTLKLVNCLKKVKTYKFFLISTIDIYFNHAYGKNRIYLEKFIKKNFQNYLILRLPGVFGKGLKKNVIYDLINKNELEKIYYNDQYQWYDLNLLKKDIEKIQYIKNSTYEFYSEPVNNKDIINLFKIKYKFNKRLKPVIYKFKPKKGYFTSKTFILKRIKKFVKNYEV
tara:strand:- start:7505 stop:8215 length:711 start_codon:yes stop_codon:yes gene_type:complete